MRIRRLLAVAAAAVGLSLLGALAAPAGAQGPGGACKVNGQYVSVDDSGRVTIGGGSGRPIDCYY